MLMNNWTNAALPMQAKGMAGSGWLQGGCFHPTNHNIMLVGGDMCGSMYRTDDFGLTWRQWSQGLHNNDWENTQYIDDIEPVILKDGSVKFFAATAGGVYARPDLGTSSWSWCTQYSYADTMAEFPLAYFTTDFAWVPHRQAIPFATLDWNGGNILYAGAGRVRYSDDSYETTFFPGCPLDTTKPGCITAPHSVWAYNVNQSSAIWTPLGDSSAFGAIRDISVTRIKNVDYVVVAARNGIYLYSAKAKLWRALHDNPLTGAALPSLNYGTPGAGLLSAWSVHLTKRGDLYVAMQKLGTDLAGGVYCMHGAISNPDAQWQYADDGANIPEFGESLWSVAIDGAQPYSLAVPQLIYMTVEERTDRDIIYVGDRGASYGLFKGVNMLDPEAFGAVSWENQIYGNNNSWVPASFESELGWLNFWGATVIFHPMLYPAISGSPTYLGMQMNARFHVSQDGGESWINAYCDGGDGHWTNRGYSQLCVANTAFMPDGVCVYTAADVGMFRTTSATQDSSVLFMPEVDNAATATDIKAASRNTYDVAVRPYWHSNIYHAIFATFTQWATTPTALSKLMMYKESEYITPEWVNVSARAPTEGAYKWYGMAFVNDDTLFVTFKRLGDNACGVYRVTYNALKGIWDWNDFTGNLDNDMAGGDNLLKDLPHELLFNSYGGRRLFLASGLGGTSGAPNVGGIWMLEDFVNPTWVRVFFDNIGFQRNVWSLAQSADGSRLYGGAGGYQGGYGGVVKCLDPSQASDPSQWLVLTESTGFAWGTNPPIWQADAPYYDFANRGMEMRALVVDPHDPDRLYAGLSGYGYSHSKGVWICNGTTWSFASESEDYIGMNVLSLNFNPYVDGQLVMGTSGIGLWRNDVVPATMVAKTMDSDALKTAGPTIMSFSKAGPRSLRYKLSRQAIVEMTIYDVRGRSVRKVNCGEMACGEYVWLWDGRNDAGQGAASGVYFARMRAAGENAASKFMLIR